MISGGYSAISAGKVESEAPRSCGGRLPAQIWGCKTAYVGILLMCVIVVIAVGGGVGGLLASRPANSGKAARGDECAWGSYRLPPTITPRHYDVTWDLTLAFAPPFAFAGTAAVDVSIAAVDPPVRCVLVHARALEIAGVTVEAPGLPAVAVSATPDSFPQSDRAIIALPAAAVGAPSLTLRFVFAGNLSDTVIGFYGSSYANGTVTVPIVQTKFEPAFARTAFPCLDEPALKATFNLSLSGVPAGYTALGNMPVLGSGVNNGAVAFECSPVMSTCE